MEYLFNNLAAFQRGNELKVSKVPSSSHPVMLTIKSSQQKEGLNYQLTLVEIKDLRDILNDFLPAG